MGYHKAIIVKGKYGEVSKIQEELDELKDSMEQGAKLMALIELSDLYGAIKGFLLNNFTGVTMEDIVQMSDLTEKSFLDGSRK